jgi:hypothetical protein
MWVIYTSYGELVIQKEMDKHEDIEMLLDKKLRTLLCSKFQNSTKLAKWLYCDLAVVSRRFKA